MEWCASETAVEKGEIEKELPPPKTISARTVMPTKLLEKEDVIREIVNIPTGPLGVKFKDGTYISEVKEGSPLTGMVFTGQKVVAVTRPGLGSIDCADMKPTELSDILVAYKDSPGRAISVKLEGQFQIKVPSGPLGVTFKNGLAAISKIRPTSTLLGKIHEGDTLLSVNDKPITQAAGTSLDYCCTEALKTADTGGERVLVFQAGQQQAIQVQPGAAAPPGAAGFCPPGAPAGGHLEEVNEFGAISCILCLLGFWCSICAPCDSKTLYIAPDGTKWTMVGAKLEAPDGQGGFMH